jgi:hypothetical protein
MTAPTQNQQPMPQAPNLHRELADRTHQAFGEISKAVHEDLDKLNTDLVDYKAATKQGIFTQGNQLKDYFDSIENDADVPQQHKDEVTATLQTLFDKFQNFDNVDDKEHRRTMLAGRVDVAREEYAEQLAARRDTSVAIKTGRKKDLLDAKFEYDVAVAVYEASEVSHLTVPENSPESEKVRARSEVAQAKLVLALGQPGEDPETNQGEKFKLGRAQRDARKARSGRYEVTEDGKLLKENGEPIEKGRFELNPDGSLLRDPNGNPVEKGRANIFTRARRAVEDKWNKWTDEARGEKWYSKKALIARAKKGAMLGVAGAAVGSVVALLPAAVGGGAIASAIAGSGAGVGIARGAKAAAGLKLNKGAERTQADAHFDRVAQLLNQERIRYTDAINNGAQINGGGASVLISERFSEGANDAHKRNRRAAIIGTITTLLAGGMAGETVHHLVYDEGMFFNGSPVSAEDLNQDGNGGGNAETGEQGGNGGTDTDTGGEQPNSGQTPEDNGNTGSGDTTDGSETPTDNRAEIPDNQRPEYPHDGGEADAPADTPENDTNTDTDTGQEDQNGNGSHSQDPDAQKDQTPDQKKQLEEGAKDILKEQEAQGPASSAEVTITPDQMDGKWVSEVYDEQLGDGGQAEMLSNADAAEAAGEIEKVVQKDGTFYYKLTEAGAAKLPGAGVGSTTTGDIMHILASHSDKFTVA